MTLPKDSSVPEACEDRAVVLPPDFAAVIDGATDIGGQRFDGRAGGALAAEAVASAFASAWSDLRQGGPDPFAAAGAALALADRAIAALYARLGLTDVVQDPARRFRAGFAVASLHGGVWRAVGAGDCAARINDAPPMLRDHPAEAVHAAWRAAMIAADPTRPEADIRALLVAGLTRADATARKAAEGLEFVDPDFARHALAQGLFGMRAARPGDALAFGVADGVGDMGQDYCWQNAAPAAEVRDIALWTDGWLLPGAGTLESWLAAARKAHDEDPRRIHRHQCVKAPTVCGRHDDMGLVLIRGVETEGGSDCPQAL
mgnify:CR=1 FL=1